MRLLFRQRLFSWFDSYDIYDEAGNTVYTVEGKLAWGHCLHILNAAGDHIGTEPCGHSEGAGADFSAKI